jgi:hypothetical protein
MACINPDPLAGIPPPLGPGGGVVDPSPLDNPRGPAWTKCFAGMFPSGSTACAATYCGPDSGPTLVNGQCVCKPLGGTAGPASRPCNNIDCGPEGGTPVSTGFGCGCSPSIGAIRTMSNPRLRDGELDRMH